MSFMHPGIDKQHIIDLVRRARTLGSIANEGGSYIKSKSDTETQQEPIKKKINLYTKDDLEIFKDKIKDKSNDEIFDMLGIEVTYNENGSKTLSKYEWPFPCYSFSSAGINEEELLDGVTEIKGDCSLISSSLKDLGSVRKIGGNLIIPLFTNAKDLSNIKSVGKDIAVDVEDAQDAVDLIKKLNLNPSKIGGYIQTGSTECAFNYVANGFYPRTKNLTETLQALQQIQAKNNY